MYKRAILAMFLASALLILIVPMPQVSAITGEYDGTEDELVVLYHFNNNTNDEGPFNILVTKYGGSYVTGQFEEGLEFDGIDDNALIFMNFTLTPPLSFSFWIKPYDTSTIKDQYIASRQDSFNVYHNQDDLTFEYRKNIGSWVTNTISNILDQDQWQKFSFEISSNTEFLTIWKNEVEIFNTALTGAWQPDVNNIYLGSYWGNTSYYDGAIDELASWNTSYTPLLPSPPPFANGNITYTYNNWTYENNTWYYNNVEINLYYCDISNCYILYYNYVYYSYNISSHQWEEFLPSDSDDGGGAVSGGVVVWWNLPWWWFVIIIIIFIIPIYLMLWRMKK